MKHLRRENRCPKCFQELGSDLEAAFRRDRTLQNLVYKLVPDLFWRQLKRRRRHIATLKRRGDSPSERRLSATRRMVGFAERLCTLDEKISLVIEYMPLTKIIDAQTNEDVLNSTSIYKSEYEFLTNICNTFPVLFKRYFRCSSEVRIKDLRKLMELKLAMTESYATYFVDSNLRTVLDDDLSLQDLVYIYTWDRRNPLHIYFTLARVSALDEDKPPVLDVEESLPQLNAEFSTNTNNDNNKQNDNEGVLSPSMDSELLSTLPRLSVSLSTSAFNNAARGGVHQPIITTFLPDNEAPLKSSISDSSKSTFQQRKRKKNSSEKSEKVKKHVKKINLMAISSSSSTCTSTSASTSTSTLTEKLKTELALVSSVTSNIELKDKLKMPVLPKVPILNDSYMASTSQQNMNLVLANPQKSITSASFTSSTSTSKPLTIPKLIKKPKLLEHQFHQQLKRVQNCVTNSSPANQSLLKSKSNLPPINNDNIFSSNFSSVQAMQKRLPADISSSSQNSGFSSITGQQLPNFPDFGSISPQQQEAAVRAYCQLMKISQNNDAMSACILAASNTANSPPFSNFYNAMAAAASNQLLAALCNNVSSSTPLASSKISDLNLFSTGNILHNGKKSTDVLQQFDSLPNKIKQKSKHQELQQQINPIKKQHFDGQKEILTLNNTMKKTEEIVKANVPSTSNKLVQKFNNHNSKEQLKTHVQQQNSKTAPFFSSTTPRLSTIGAAPLLSANSS